MRWSARIDAYVKTQLKNKDVIALTEVGRLPQKFAGAGLIVGDKPPKGDPAGAAAIALSPRAQGMVIGSGNKGSRIVWVRLKAQFTNLFIVSVYLPHKARKCAPFQEDTLRDLQSLLRIAPAKGDCIIVMGDMNAKLARSQQGITGKYCMHAKADSGGEGLTEVMQAFHLSAASTYFCPPRKAPLGQATYRPKVSEHTPSQIDYVLISQRWLSSVRSSKVEWRHSIARFGHPWDHGMISINLHMRINKEKVRRSRPDRKWLEDEGNARTFNEAYKQAKKSRIERQSPDSQTVSPIRCESRAKVASQEIAEEPVGAQGEQGVDAGGTGGNLDDDFEVMSSALRSALTEVPPVSKLRKFGRRSSQRTIDLVAARASTLQGHKPGSPEFKSRMALFKKQITASCREDYREHVDGIIADMESADDRGYSKGVQEGIHLLSGKKKGGGGRQPAVDENGGAIALPEELAEAWSTFCGRKFAETERELEREEMLKISPAADREGDVPTTEELEFCLAALSKQKATGPDLVPIEAYRASGEAKGDLFALVRRIWKEEDVPEDLVLCELITIFKNKGSSDDYTKYRCIGLLNHAYKVLSTLLLKRMLEEINGFLPESQAGFRKLRSTRDNIFLLATLMDAVLESQETCVLTFIDFVAAFDSVSHKFLAESLHSAGASVKSRAMFRAIYRKAKARVRVTTQGGEEHFSSTFPVCRGVIQGDIFSPLCFIVALEAIMRSHGGSGKVSAFGILLDRLEYADDAALVDRDAKEASERVTRLCAGALEDADMEISAPKSEVMFCRPRVDLGAITADDFRDDALAAIDVALDFKCQHCGRGFDSKHGKNVHEGRHCRLASKEWHEEEFEVEAILDARGRPDNRFYFVKWKGWDVEDGQWTHHSELGKVQEQVDAFWDTRPIPDRAKVISVSGENRCVGCNKQFKREQDVKAHLTRGCERADASRAGSRAEKAVAKARQVAIQDAAGTVEMGEKTLKNVFNFGYLGFRFQADGDRMPALEQRMAIARTRFGELHEIWRSNKLPTSAKLRIYACAVVSVLTYGNEIWCFDQKVLKKLRGWNARCLVVLTGRDYREETVEPSFDLVARLRSRRLRWAGHILRQEETSLLRRVFVAQLRQALEEGGIRPGSLLMDAPDFETVEQLEEMAGDREAWRYAVRMLLPETDPDRSKGRKGKKKKGYSDAFMVANGFHLEGKEWVKNSP
jgi:exonuclease III